MLYLQIESPKSSVLNFLDSNSFEVIISIFQRTEKVPDMERLRTDNYTMNLKIDPCIYNITQLTCQKGIKSLRQISEQLLNCQGSLIVAIPAVHSACRYWKVSHRIHSYMGSCYTA